MTTFNGTPWIAWASGAPWVPSSTVALYGLAVMRAPNGRRGIDSTFVRQFFVAWNVGMALFSGWCTAVTVPHFLFGPRGFATRGLVSAVCSDAEWFSHGPPGVVALIFTLSKFVELGDTAFLVLRKKSLTHLHTFHHAMTLALTWSLYERRASTGLVFIAMNAFIHTVMYAYYAAVLYPKARVFLLPHSHWITTFQITQMVVGIFVNLLAARELIAGRSCNTPPVCIAAAGALYTIYAILFVQFAIERARPKRA
jgi:elongation of very long chain fatty acids protein 6